MLNNLMLKINFFKPKIEVPDVWKWIITEDGKFSVNSAFHILNDRDATEENRVFKSLWKIPAPSNVIAFGWRALLGRLQTRDNLVKRNIIIAGQDSQCVFCNEAEEDSNHLLVSCKFAWEVWSSCYRWWGIQSVIPNDCCEHFEQHFYQVNCTKKDGWMLIWCTCIWSIWLMRNDIIFKNAESDLLKVMEAIKFRSWNWLRHKNKSFSYSFFEWSNNPKECLGGGRFYLS